MSNPPDPRPGERRLARPPSERYRPSADPAEPPSPRSPARGFVLGLAAALGGAVVTVLLGGPLALSAGLLVVAAVIGWLVGAAVRTGAGSTLPARSRRVAAASIALGGVLLAQLGLWLFAQMEGGVLPLVDYLAQTYGLLVPGQAVAAALIAWWTAR